ncbi:MAG: glycosyltransferase family 2 protein [Flavobacteriaceae bacterium]|mgnify:CR=1 FL=1
MKNNNANKVSVIIPVFNASKFIKQTINSVLNQTYKNWEILAIDDYSSDNSFEILKHYSSKEKRIKVLQNNKNLGAFAARNLGIKMSSGDYIAFLDSDDLWRKDKLEIQINFMKERKCNFTYTGLTRFHKSLTGKEKIIKVPEKVNYNFLMTNTVIVTSTVVVNIKNIGSFQMENIYYDDYILWLTLLKREKFAYGINKPLMDYRILDDSLSRNKFKSAIKVYEIFHKNLNLSSLQAKYKFILWAINSNLKYYFKY